MMLHSCTFSGCNLTFSRPYRLKLHLLQHSGEKPFSCKEENCEKTFSNPWHLKRHQNTVHNKIKKTKICPVENCQRIILFDNLKRHLKCAHKQLPYFCQICKKSFRKKNQLKSHMYEHTGLAPYKCEHCEKNFVHISDYKKHQSAHKSYTCSCQQIFYKWSVYLKHRKEDHKEEFTCEECGKKFTNKRNFKIHLNCHKSERDIFICPYENCDRKYYYKKNLQYHIDVLHLRIKNHKQRGTHLKHKKGTEKSSKRATRKDKGTMKKSSVLNLTGLTIPYEAEKKLLSGEQIEMENDEDAIETSDFSDYELTIKVFKRNNVLSTSSEDESKSNKPTNFISLVVNSN